MAPWAVSTLVRVRVQKADGAIVDISEDVRTIGRARPMSVKSGRQNELDELPPGSLTFVIDNASGDYTPGRSAAACELTLNMLILVDEGIGYRTFPIFTGRLQVPETVEQLEAVDNLITVTAVDAKQLQDNGRKFISVLAEYVMLTHRETLQHYYPLNEAVAPFRDVAGDGPDFDFALAYSSLFTATTAQPARTPGGGAALPGDDLKGVEFTPTTSDAGGLGFPSIAAGYILRAEFAQAQAVAFTTGQPLTLIVWAAMPNAYDTQDLIKCLFSDGGAQQSDLAFQRIVRHTSAGADAGLLEGILSASGGGMAGAAKSVGYFTGTGESVFPFAIQVTYTPNAIRIWAGTQEWTDAAPTGVLTSPQYLAGFIDLGPLEGSLAHFQIHVGAFSHDDFLAQYQHGMNGLRGQRTDERIATILAYAAGDQPAVLDEGSTTMQATGLAGKTPGQVIDAAVQTERGRYFIGPDGVARFHARTRAYNL